MKAIFKKTLTTIWNAIIFCLTVWWFYLVASTISNVGNQKINIWDQIWVDWFQTVNDYVNKAKDFIPVPADGSEGFNKNNLVWLDDSGKLPSAVLPASAGGSGGWRLLILSCWPCPDWFSALMLWTILRTMYAKGSSVPIYNAPGFKAQPVDIYGETGVYWCDQLNPLYPRTNHLYGFTWCVSN